MRAVNQVGVLLLLAIISFRAAAGESLPEEPTGDQQAEAKRSLMTEKTANHTVDNPVPAVKEERITTDLFSFKPEMLQTFYVFLGISFLLIFFIVYRLFRMRSHRAERRYGVHGDKAAQELTHLPTAIEEDDSELEEDDTVFDINKMRVYVA